MNNILIATFIDLLINLAKLIINFIPMLFIIIASYIVNSLKGNVDWIWKWDIKDLFE